VYARTEKSIPISEPVRIALGLAEGVTRLSPPEVLRAILTAPADLLWNGGIGTYVKASSQSNLEVGDKANDAIRINGRDLRVKVVGEGGNLGLTQLGRIEAARHGVALNTDAVDNSAGVDCSDHEVNIKIALDRVVADGDLTMKQRNSLLADMTDEVAALVLQDNYDQNILLGNARARSASMMPVHQRFLTELQARGLLDRELENLPNEEQVRALRDSGEGLTSPEFCTLMAYSKIAVTADLNSSDLADDAYYTKVLRGYFPQPLQSGYAQVLDTHPLRRQIISTVMANAMINKGGITFAYRVSEETGASVAETARAFTIAREVFALDDYWNAVCDLDNKAPTMAQAMLNLEIRRLLDRASRWWLTVRGDRLDVAAEIARFAQPVQQLAPMVPDLLVGPESERMRERAAEFVAIGAPEELSLKVAALLDVFSLLDVTQVAAKYDTDPQEVARVYFQLSEMFGIDGLLGRITDLPRSDRWDALARSALRSDVYGVLAGLTAKVLRTSDSADAGERIAAWQQGAEEGTTRVLATLDEIMAAEHSSLATISVALRMLRTLVYQNVD
jgi:glutamate dehydrogenase